LAEEIVQKFKIEPELVKSSGGVFEVSLDENLVFSKKALGRHAEEGEVVAILAARL
jgi:selenoprotein W-related protein